jgi:molybdopterin converting factor small subunit
MSVKIKIFYPELKRRIHNADSVLVDGNTVGECLRDLVRLYPDVKELIYDQQGRLLKQVYVYVNSESLNKVDFATPVTASDEIILAVLITGG